MIHSNLHLLVDLNHQKLSKEEISLGAKAYAPSGLGGVIKVECAYVDQYVATFTPVDSDYPSWMGIEVRFNQPELSQSERTILSTLMGRSSNSWSDDDRVLINKAKTLGYVNILSWSQVEWREMVS
ncbi:TPA: hypothetical protein I7682_17880 [Vibrio vulnificus]|nr:hypothetical protein [Vibrio vulnificus]